MTLQIQHGHIQKQLKNSIKIYFEERQMNTIFFHSTFAFFVKTFKFIDQLTLQQFQPLQSQSINEFSIKTFQIYSPEFINLMILNKVSSSSAAK
jgi:hypothetical protein